MGTEEWDSAAIEIALLKYETLERLKRAIDYRQQRLLESAKQEWEQSFARQDPSDACVSVRINATVTEAPASTVPCAGYFAKRKPLPGGETRSRLA
jgi:hypothetical protein